MTFRLVIILCLLLVSTTVLSAPVFKITKGEDVVYIGGTFHLLTEKDYPLPDSFELAYDLSDVLVFETDINGITHPDFQPQLMRIITYQNGGSLKQNLLPKTFKRLEEYAKSRGLIMQQLSPLNPTGIMLTVAIMEYQSRGFVAQGVDKFFFDRALADEKEISWFETPEEQLAILDGFDNDDPDGAVNQVLDEVLSSDEAIKALHESWRNGDMDKLTALGLSDYLEYPLVYKNVIKDRNDKWVEKIEAMFDNEKTEYVLVGALHLPGKDGVLTQFAEKGYKVERL